jgi:hypothetical protein
MFRKLGTRYAVESDDGFVVSRSGSPLTQFVITYQEGSRLLDYPLENLMPGSVTPILVSSIRNWNSPESLGPLSLDKRREIAQRISDAMRFLGDKSCVIE